MSARDFLVRGLLAGLIAGFVAFGVAYTVGEPSVQAAINVEESGSATTTHDHSDSTEHSDEAAGHSHSEDGTVVSRQNQSTWGLLTGTLTSGIALGGITALVAAGVMGRVGRLTAVQSTALVAATGFTAYSLVPFLKYPASPPAVGNPDTIGSRTGLYFAYLFICLAAAILAWVLASRLTTTKGGYVGTVAGLAVFLVITVATGLILPTVNEVGDFPADTLWYFRRASILTQASLWATVAVVLTWYVGRLAAADQREADRRALAASL